MHAVQVPIAKWPHHINAASMEPVPTQPTSPATIMRHKPGIGSSGGMSPSASESGCHTDDAEIGHRTTSFCLLANISLAVGKRLEWDSKAERFTNCDAANDLLHYEYRKPYVLSVD